VQVDMWSLGVITYILLCGYPPFSHPKQHHLFSLIRAASFRFDSPAWDGVSPQARDLIARLLVVDPTRRLTSRELLRHPWITGTIGERQLRGVRQQMRGFGVRSNKMIKSGPLVKQGHVIRNWKERNFVLVGHALEYFELDSFRQKGSVPLREVTEVTAMKRRGTFRVATARGYELVMQAASEAIASSWMRCITAQKAYTELMERAAAALEADRVREAARLTRDAQRYEEYVERARKEGEDAAAAGLDAVDESSDESSGESADDEGGYATGDGDDEDDGGSYEEEEGEEEGGEDDGAGVSRRPRRRASGSSSRHSGAGGSPRKARSRRGQSGGSPGGDGAAADAAAAGLDRATPPRQPRRRVIRPLEADDASDMMSVASLARNAEVFLPAAVRGGTPRNADGAAGLGAAAREAVAGDRRAGRRRRRRADE